jgi:hypothetical protein
VLGHEVHPVCQCGGQGEDDSDGHVTGSDQTLGCECIGGFWTLEEFRYSCREKGSSRFANRDRPSRQL